MAGINKTNQLAQWYNVLMNIKKKYFKEVSCVDCGEKRTIRKDSKAIRCAKCSASIGGKAEKPNRIITSKFIECIQCGVLFKKYKSDDRMHCSVKCGAKTIGEKLKAKESDSVRFWKNVKKGDGCWEWQGAKQSYGYGVFLTSEYGRKLIRAHRFVIFLTNGAYPEKNIEVCHKCDNPPCVRPDHLFLGTHKDNMMDMKLKGRSRKGKFFIKNGMKAVLNG